MSKLELDCLTRKISQLVDLITFSNLTLLFSCWPFGNSFTVLISFLVDDEGGTGGPTLVPLGGRGGGEGVVGLFR